MLGDLFKQCLFRLYRAAQYQSLSSNPSILSILSKYPKLELSPFSPGESGSGIFIRGTDVDVTAPQRRFLLRGSNLLARLLEETQARFRSSPTGALVEVNDVRLQVENWEELFIATEVFAEGIYNLKLPGPFVVIDIGMNVGTTALFFASQPNCTAIYAFEPFPATVKKAGVNLGLNPSLATKIEVTAQGVAARAFEAELEYFEEFKGSIGMKGLPEYIDRKQITGRAERVRVRFADCKEVFAGVLKKHPSAFIVAKVDCEGSEYEILESLAGSGLISCIDCFLLEWHLKGAAPLEQLLSRFDFCQVSLSPRAPTHSMIYAWRLESGVGRQRLSATLSRNEPDQKIC